MSPSLPSQRIPSPPNQTGPSPPPSQSNHYAGRPRRRRSPSRPANSQWPEYSKSQQIEASKKQFLRQHRPNIEEGQQHGPVHQSGRRQRQLASIDEVEAETPLRFIDSDASEEEGVALTNHGSEPERQPGPEPLTIPSPARSNSQGEESDQPQRRPTDHDNRTDLSTTHSSSDIDAREARAPTWVAELLRGIDRQNETIRGLTEEVREVKDRLDRPTQENQTTRTTSIEKAPSQVKTAFTWALHELMGTEDNEEIPLYPDGPELADFTLSDQMDVSVFEKMGADKVSEPFTSKPLRIRWSKLTSKSPFENALVNWATRWIIATRGSYRISEDISAKAIKTACKESLRARQSRLKTLEQDRETYRQKEAVRKRDARRKERVTRRMFARRATLVKLNDYQGEGDYRLHALQVGIVSPDESMDEDNGRGEGSSRDPDVGTRGILRPPGWSSKELINLATELDLATPRRRGSHRTKRPSTLVDPVTLDTEYRVPAKVQRWMISGSFAKRHLDAVKNAGSNRGEACPFGSDMWGARPSERFVQD